MAKLYRGREWQWWISTNNHKCKFCLIEKDLRISIHTGYPPDNQCQRGFWHRAYYKWLKHMKEYHPEILAEAETPHSRGNK
ncbi:hypothetical protein LCGC14_1511220 [marine sediment metagenome]|uniref:Uncharacterized protein n=1 Tax=marine sediment metagenome TaxID=412755 RepID=A0A0F9JM28_9ZZZZ